MNRPASASALVPALPVLAAFEAGRTTPLRLGLWIFGAMLLLRAAVLAPLLRLDPLFRDAAESFGLRDVRIGVVLALVLGYAPACYGWAVRGLRAQLDALRPLFVGAGRALDDARREAGHLPRRTRRRALVAGVAISLLVPFVVDRDPALYLESRYWQASNILNWILLPFAGMLVMCVCGSLWADAQRLTALAERIEPLDLLDDCALVPFGRAALRLALLTVAFPSFGAVLLADRGFAEMILVVAIAGATAATTAFLLPVQGIHRRLVREKAAELVRVRSALRGDAAALGKSGLRGWSGRATPADLLAYEARIAAVREWPFDVPTLARFAALFLLPLGSWLGGALVEHVVSKLLG